MKLDAGSVAPSFETQDAGGKQWKVPGEPAGKYLVLVFLRHLGCPLCMKRIDELNSDAMRFNALGASVIAVVDGTSERVRGFASKKNLAISLVGDKGKKIYEAYGVERGRITAMLAPNVLKESLRATLKGYMHGKFEGDELQKPADFIIAPDGKILWAHYGKDISDSTSNEILIEELSRSIKSKK